MGAVLLLGVFSGFAEGGTAPAEAAATVATAPRATSMTADEFAAGFTGRRDQRAFVDAAVAGGIDYLATTNELKQRLLEKTRDRAVCDAVPSRTVNRWVGRINRLTVNSQGMGILEVQIGYRTTLSTQDSTFSGGSEKTMIPFGSDDYKVLSEMHEGDLIEFAGTFLEGHETCLWQRTWGLPDGMKTPNFAFRFKDVAEYRS